MKGKLIATGLTAALTVFAAAAAGGATTHHSCGNLSATVGNIKAYNTTCKIARKVVAADSNNKKFDDWKCKGRRINTGADVTCTHQGGAKVTYQMAD